MAELPWQDDTPMDSDCHRLQGIILQECLRLHLAGRTDIFVGADMALYYSTLQPPNRGFRAPDFFVVFDARPFEGDRLSWVVWEEARTPSIIVELLSASTEATDRSRKMTVYARALHTQEYYLVGPVDARFEAYRLDPQSLSYTPVAVHPVEGALSPLLGRRLALVEGTFLGVRNRWLRFVDAAGELLPTGEELARAESELARAESERARAESERAERLAAKLRALGVDPAGCRRPPYSEQRSPQVKLAPAP